MDILVAPLGDTGSYLFIRKKHVRYQLRVFIEVGHLFIDNFAGRRTSGLCLSTNSARVPHILIASKAFNALKGAIVIMIRRFRFF